MSIIGRALGFMGGANAHTYATWNPSDKAAAVTLSGGNLVATWSTTAAYSSARADTGKSASKWYSEHTLTTFGTDGFIGIGLATASTANFVGFDANGVGIENTGGNRYNNNTSAAYGYAGGNLVAGDVIGLLMDCDNRQINIYRNNSPQGVITYSVWFTGTIFPMISGDHLTVWTSNFGASAFVYSVPSGYNSGLYT